MSEALAIVHTESSLGWGGQELRILSESRGLARRGHQLTLLCPPEGRLYAEAPAWDLRVVAMPIARKTVAGLLALRRWFGQNRCHVVSTHSSTDSWLSALALASLRDPVPMVRTRHISAPVPRNALSRWLYRRPARIVTTGDALRRDLIERLALEAAKVQSVPTGVDPERYRPGDRRAARAALGLPLDAPIIGIVATLRSWKGHRDLVEALAGMASGALLVIVGDGPQRGALESQIHGLGLQERVRLAGNQRDVVPWLQAFDVFALPSYANEGVPQALLQAMLTGLPCVTTDIGSIGELAANEATALVVPPRDPARLRAALERVLGDQALRQRLGEAARTHCATSMSEARMLDRMEALYREVTSIDQSSPRS
ncbi:MAG TPA: glycosyltransferase family 4 protein [Burkholderiales bacterium]